MKTTVVHRRPSAPLLAASARRRAVARRPDQRLARQDVEPWSTGRIGVAVSLVAAAVAVVVAGTTTVPTSVIVLAVMAAGFTVSCRLTARRHRT